MNDSVSPEHIDNGIIVLKVTGALSVIGSTLMLRDLHHRYRRDKSLPLTASILSELAAADWISSFMCVMGTWMAPKESGAYLAAGNTASCTAQGFLINMFFGVSSASNACLAATYCFIVRRRWKDDLTRKRNNYILLVFPSVFYFIFALIPLFFDAYNYDGISVCNMAAHPPNCLASPEIDCTRGEIAPVFYLGATVLTFVSNTIIIVAMVMLIRSVLKQEKRMGRYAARGSQSSRDLTSKTAWQGLWYITAYAIAFWPFYVRVTIETLTGVTPTAFIYITNLTFPAQGVWNALVYFRPRYKKEREQNPADRKLNSMGRVLRLSISLRSTRREGLTASTDPEQKNGDLEMQEAPENNT